MMRDDDLLRADLITRHKHQRAHPLLKFDELTKKILEESSLLTKNDKLEAFL